jgi:transcriptional regulator with XRE-family HTH domain
MKQSELGRKIVELRKAQGLTQEELASKSNVTVRTLQRIEAGVVTPRSYTIKLISTALDCSIYDFSERNSEKRVFTHFKDKTEQLYKWAIDLFNLKTNTMKKISILSTSTLILSFILFVLTSEGKAQKSIYDKFIPTNGRGIVYLFPKEFRKGGYISNMKDTADYKIGKYLVQEYKHKIFLNGKFVTKVLEGDTVVLNKGKIAMRQSYWQFNSSPDNGIVYFIPANLMMDNYSHWGDTNTMVVGNFHFKEYNHKVFQNGTYVGTANSGDTVIMKNGNLTILNSR